ncbi:MAG: hypothetical protein GY812_08255 [Actinomycetia bacterium]|nr:hypothetical protein [Actinomycetes bacterium]
MSKRHTARIGVVSLFAAIGLIAAACAPPAAPPAQTWEVSATKVVNVDSQDEIRDPVFGWCIAIPNCNDEPYVINIGTRVKIGVPNSASGFVKTSRDNNPEDVPEGETRNLSGDAGAPAVFTGVRPLDVGDLLNTNNKLEVVVVYSWVMEEDLVAVNTAANDVKDILVDALNSTLAAGSLPNDAEDLVDLILNNLGSAFTLLLSNIPLLGLGDDVGGGALHVGIGAKGALAGIVDTAIGAATIPSFDIPILDLPPDIKHVNIFSMAGTSTFTGQRFDQYGDGIHDYDFRATPLS